MVLGVGEPVHEREQAAGRRNRPGDVDRLAGRANVPAQQRRGADRGDEREGEIHEQRPAPRQGLGEHAAEQQPDSGTGAADRPPDPKRRAPLARIGERRAHQRQRRGCHQRREHALQPARRHENPEALCRAAESRRGAESDGARDEQPLAAEQITDPPTGEQQAAERERVRGHDPLPAVVGEMQRLLRRGQRDVDHRNVEHDHQLRDPEDREDPPTPRGNRVPAPAAVGSACATSCCCLLGHSKLLPGCRRYVSWLPGCALAV